MSLFFRFCHKRIKIILCGLILGLFFYPAMFLKTKAEEISTSVSVSISVCGNNIQEEGEACDGTDLNNQSCRTQGFLSGILGCKLDCTFNTINCTNSVGGGGGVTYVLPLPQTQVIFSGKAYPQSKVILLKDGQEIAATIAGGDAGFEIDVTDISTGSYVFLFYSEDYAGRRSTPMTIPITVTSGIITRVNGIFLAPTIETDKVEIKKGDNLTIFGQSASNAEVTISVNSETESFFKTSSDQNGRYSYNLDTSSLDLGEHLAKSKASVSGLISSYGKAVNFKVSAKNIYKKNEEKIICDLDNNNRVDLADFSIMAYWYKRSSPPIIIDLNHDGLINIRDFSILAYYWTG